MDASGPDGRAARVAAAIGEPARARMLYSLSDGRARTSTELAAIAGVAPSTASIHLRQLRDNTLVTAVAQGKHRYYSLGGPHVAAALEALSVVAGVPRDRFIPSTPSRLRGARTCYDHLAGALGVRLHDRFVEAGWVTAAAAPPAYALTESGEAAFARLGLDVNGLRCGRRRLAFACLDWSERRSHLGGALAAAILDMALGRRWISREPGSRCVTVTPAGRGELRRSCGLVLDAE